MKSEEQRSVNREGGIRRPDNFGEKNRLRKIVSAPLGGSARRCVRTSNLRFLEFARLAQAYVHLDAREESGVQAGGVNLWHDYNTKPV